MLLGYKEREFNKIKEIAVSLLENFKYIFIDIFQNENLTWKIFDKNTYLYFILYEYSQVREITLEDDNKIEILYDLHIALLESFTISTVSKYLKTIRDVKKIIMIQISGKYIYPIEAFKEYMSEAVEIRETLKDN